MYQKIRRKRGITLIVLLVTILILIILAGVTIVSLKNTNLLNNTIKARKKSDYETANELMKIKLSAIELDYKLHGKGLSKLQFTADRLCEDDDIEYVLTEGRKESSIAKIKLAQNVTKIYTKLKKYNYEFEINNNIQIASINGKKVNEYTSITISYSDRNTEETLKELKILNITNESDFIKFRDNVNSGVDYKEQKIILSKDIDLTEICKKNESGWITIGNNEHPFNGTFDGRGHTIKGLTIDSNSNNIGLFGTNIGIIENVILDNSNIKVIVDSGIAITGAIVGTNNGIVYRVGTSANNTIYCESQSSIYCGGIVGQNQYAGVIKECYNKGSVKGINKNYYGYTGGIAGRNDGGTVDSCYNSGLIENYRASGGGYNTQTGGIIGEIGSGYVCNCYNSGVLKGNNNVASISGCSYGYINNCYWLNISPNIVIAYGKDYLCKNYDSKTADDLKQMAPYLGIAFKIDSKGGYPLLNWE